jgi:hypothetical protein
MRRIDFDVAGVTADLASVDALARLQLNARRLGRTLRLRNVSRELAGLIELTGLVDVLRLEPRREAEEREERLGVEEERELSDPAL